jgi:DNA-binding transcriptional ArsR family regulator
LPAVESKSARKDAIAKAFAHPVRHRAFRMLTDAELSPSQIADRIDVDLHSVSYHVRALEKMGLIEQVGEKQVRGAVQHFFRAIDRPILTTEDWAKLTLGEREEASRYIMQLIVGDTVYSEETGVLDQRLDRTLSRVPLIVDEAGWRELHDIHMDVLDRILEVQANSADRLANSPEAESFPAMTGSICIEMPQG